MALTAEEQKELDELNRQLDAPASGLSSSESSELDQLNAELAKPQTSATEAAGLGFAKGATLGFAPAITGAANAVLGETPSTAKYSPETIQKLLSQKEALKARGIDVENSIQDSESSDLGKAYRAGRGATNEIFDEAQAAHPVAFGAGNVAGNVATGLVLPGSTTIKGMAAQGAVQGLGESKADLTKGQFTEAARNTTEGAVGGAVGGFIGKGVGAVLGASSRRFGEGVSNTAEYFDRHALGTQGQVGGKSLDKINAASDFAKSQDILNPLSSTKEMLAKVKTLHKDASDKFEAASKALEDDKVYVDAIALSKSVKDKLVKDFDDVAVLDTIEKKIQKTGNTPTGIETLKRQFTKQGWSGKGQETPTVEGQAYRDAKTLLDNLYTEEVSKLAASSNKPELINNYLNAKSNWGNIKTLERGLEGKQAADQGIMGYVRNLPSIAAQATSPTIGAVAPVAVGIGKGLTAIEPAVAQAGKTLGVKAAETTDEEARLRKEAIAKILAGG